MRLSKYIDAMILINTYVYTISSSLGVALEVLQYIPEIE